MAKGRYLSGLMLFGLTPLLGGCKMALLEPKGIIAATEAHLLVFSTLLMLIIVIPVIVLTFVFAWKYRAGNTKAKYSPTWGDSTLLEVICWSIPCAIILILAVITWTSTHKLDPYKPLASKTKPLTIQAVALDWKWLFIYPSKHIATLNYVQIPIHTAIQFQITSDAPMNSLEIPQLAGQIYAMTGMQTKLYLRADQKGSFTGLSTNFSGNGFSTMRFVVKVSSQKQFDKWLKKARGSKRKLSLSMYNKLAKPSEDNPVRYFSSPAENLFKKIIMKYMMPNMPIVGMSDKHPEANPAKNKP